MAARGKSNAILMPNLGLHLSHPSIAIPDRALADGMNFRIREGRIDTRGLGWQPWQEFDLRGACILIANFFPKDVGEALVFGTKRWLYQFDAPNAIKYLNPRFNTGTVSVDTATPSVATFSADISAELQVGDILYVGGSTHRDPNDTWYTISSIPTAFTAHLTEQNNTVYTAQPFTALKRFTMDDVDWWDWEVFAGKTGEGDRIVLTNGADWVVSWDGLADTVQVHNEMGFRARTLVRGFNMMLYANLVSAGESLKVDLINSDVGSPFNAGDAGTGLSEQFRLHDGSDEILSLRRLGNSVVAYSNDHAVVIDFVGDPEIFSFRPALLKTGPLGPFAIGEFPDHHVFLGRDGMYVFDGVTATPTDIHFWPKIMRTQDPIRRTKITNFHNEQLSEMIWSVPLTTDPGSGSITADPVQAQVMHYVEDVGQGNPTPYSRREFPFLSAGIFNSLTPKKWSDFDGKFEDMTFTWNDEQLGNAYATIIVGKSNGKIYTLDTSQMADGEPLESWVLTPRRPLQDHRGRALLRRVYPFIRKTANILRVTAILSDRQQGNVDIIHRENFDMDASEELNFVSFFNRGRYIELEFRQPEGKGWVMEGYDLDITHGGTR